MRSWPAVRRMALLVALASATGGAPAAAQVYPPGFNDELVVEGLDIPTCFAFTPDGHILIGQQGGTIRLFEAGQLLPDPVLSLAVEPFSEQGLLGMALARGFPDPPYLYVCYTPPRGTRRETTTASRASRWWGTRWFAGSEVVVLDASPRGMAFTWAAACGSGAMARCSCRPGTRAGSRRGRRTGRAWRGSCCGSTPTGPFRRTIPSWACRASAPRSTSGVCATRSASSMRAADGDPVHRRRRLQLVGGDRRGAARRQLRMARVEGFADQLRSRRTSIRCSTMTTDWARLRSSGTCSTRGTTSPPSTRATSSSSTTRAGIWGAWCWDLAHEVVSVTMPFIETAAVGNLSGPVDLQLGPDGALYYCTYSPGAIRRIYYSGPGNRNPTAIGQRPAPPRGIPR